MKRRDFLKVLASGASAVVTYGPLSLRAISQPAASPLNKINHFVVLMLENRSFDNMLGALGRFYDAPSQFDGLSGTEYNSTEAGQVVQVNNVPGTGSNALGIPYANPGEKWIDINEQLFGTYPDPPSNATPTMGGFVKNYMRHNSQFEPRDPKHVMHYFTPDQVPVLSRLALEFAVCDRWFASAPCQTWPNRFFMHAGTAKDIAHPDALGYEDNKYQYSAAPVLAPISWFSWLISWVLPSYGRPPTLAFSSPTIFSKLQKAIPKNQWKIYWTDFSHASTMQEVLDQLNNQMFGKADVQFLNYSQFLDDCKGGALPAYSFIEPSFEFDANDQHPPRELPAGERLIAEIYNALRNGPRSQWLSTMFIIIYDEHGGLYDHVPPPVAVSPDATRTQPFNFDRYGVRVPAVLVSPYIKPRTILRPPPGARYPFDHTSIIATLRKRFVLGDPLSARDAAAPDLEGVLNLEGPTNLGPDSLAAGDASWFAR